jgi:hypothetical protein
MGIFSRSDEPRPRAWWQTTCKSDPRFNMSGEASGIWAAQEEIDKAVLAKAKELGAEPPSDIEYSGGKE